MFKIISDIGADIPNEFKESIIVISQEVSINGEDIFVSNNESSMVSFYKNMSSAQTYATRSLRMEEVVNVIRGEQGETDILCFSFSQKLSATGEQMMKACLATDAKPNRVHYFDTKTASLGQGVLVYLATQCRKNGMTIEQTKKYLSDAQSKLSFYVILDKSSHFLSGGRASNLENEELYYPILILKPGELYECVGYTLVKEDAIRFVEEKIKKQPQSVVFIGHGSNKSEAVSIKTRLSSYSEIIGTCFANPVMGVHTGDNAILVAYLRK